MTKSDYDKENLESMKSIIMYEIELFHEQKWIKFKDSLGKNILSSTPFWKRIGCLQNKKRTERIGTIYHDGK